MGKDKPYDPGGTLLILLVIFRTVFMIGVPDSATVIPIQDLFRNDTWYDLVLDVLVDDKENELLPFELRKLDKLMKFAKRQLSEQSFSERFLSLNRGGKFRGDLLVWLPVSFVLPTLKKNKQHFYKRSADFSNATHNHSTLLDELRLVYDPNSTDYIFDKNLGPLLSRLDGYYGLLGVEDEACRYLIDCYIGNTGEQLSPVSDLLSKVYGTSEQFDRPTTFSKPLLRFFRHYWAFKKGYSNKEFNCDSEYKNCNSTITEFLNWTTLKFWQDLSSMLSIQLQDE